MPYIVRINFVLSCFGTFVLFASLSSIAKADESKPRVLMVTESKGFVHQPVKRPEGDLATSEIAMGSKLGIDATKKLAGEGFKRRWPPLIRMDPMVTAKVEKLMGS